MFEWILDDRGRFHWVDLKELATDYLTGFALAPPGRYDIGPCRSSGEPMVLSNTSLAGLSVMAGQVAASWECATGSPLAHLCVAAYLQGIPLAVLEEPLSRGDQASNGGTAADGGLLL